MYNTRYKFFEVPCVNEMHSFTTLKSSIDPVCQVINVEYLVTLGKERRNLIRLRLYHTRYKFFEAHCVNEMHSFTTL